MSVITVEDGKIMECKFKIGDPCFCYDKDLSKKGKDKNYNKMSLTRIIIDDTWFDTLEKDYSSIGRYYLTELEAKNLFNNWIEGKII
jgi:hypothetical protein